MYIFPKKGHPEVSSKSIGKNMGEFKMTDKMKLGLVLIGIAVAFIVQLIVGVPREVEANIQVETEALRLRVIAHSDDEVDQLLKRVAVFAIEDFMNQNEMGYTGAFLRNNLEELRASVETVFEEIGTQVAIEVSFGHHYFPASEGYYPSLVVRLGEAAGENWWCFINPGVCIVPTDDDASVNTAQVEVRTELQESMGTRALAFISGLFGGGEGREVAEGEIDWFLFDDER